MDHITKIITSDILIQASSETIWEQITNVRIEAFSDPFLFKLLDIPKPLKADVTKEGLGGSRIAYFDNDKKFIQKITAWEYLKTYTFTFHPEENFRTGYFFDLANGPFRMISGTYDLKAENDQIRLYLQTKYSVSRSQKWFLGFPIRMVLLIFQRYLLKSIKRISEAHAS